MPVLPVCAAVVPVPNRADSSVNYKTQNQPEQTNLNRPTCSCCLPPRLLPNPPESSYCRRPPVSVTTRLPCPELHRTHHITCIPPALRPPLPALFPLPLLPSAACRCLPATRFLLHLPQLFYFLFFATLDLFSLLFRTCLVRSGTDSHSFPGSFHSRYLSTPAGGIFASIRHSTSAY